MSPTSLQALQALQSLMADAVRAEEPLAEDAERAARLALLATGNARLSPVEQVEIYREQFWLRHVASLEEDFPTLHFLLGGAAFDDLCRVYLRAHPPDGFSLRDLAAAMPNFLTQAAPYREDTLLADCANVEWAFIEAFDADDAPPFDPAILASTDEDAWAGARLVLHPSVRLLALAHPAHDFRAAVRRGQTPTPPEAQPTYVVVHRSDEVVHCTPAEPMAFALLERLAKGMALGAACEEVAAIDAAVDLEAKVAVWFQAWVSAGWLSAIQL